MSSSEEPIPTIIPDEEVLALIRSLGVPVQLISREAGFEAFLHPNDMAILKGVTFQAIYLAMKDGRLRSIKTQSELSMIRVQDAIAWTPRKYTKKAGKT